jgi:cytosine deaminase
VTAVAAPGTLPKNNLPKNNLAADGSAATGAAGTRGRGYLISRVTLPDPPGIRDVVIRDGMIESVQPSGSVRPDGLVEIDGKGLVALPALVEPHAHLDKALTADMVPNERGDLTSAITAWVSARPTMATADITRRALETAYRYLAHGTTAIRTHTDTGAGIGARAVQALLSVRATLQGTVDVQVVAACSVPSTGVAGADNRATFLAALDAGADVIGGAPWLDPEPLKALDYLLSVAAERRLPVDLHLDETLDVGTLTLVSLAERVVGGFPAAVTASHCVSLGVQPPDVQRTVAASLAAANISVVALPQTNLYLQGRAQASSPPRGITAIAVLREAGVVVAAGGDNIQDPFNPMGRADPLETASLLVTAGHRHPLAALEAVTGAARSVLGLASPAVAVSQPADLVLVPGPGPAMAMAGASPERTVIRQGRVVARTRVTTEFERGRPSRQRPQNVGTTKPEGDKP